MKTKKGEISSLPKVVGVMADFHYTKQEWVKTLILKVRPNTVITTTTGGGMEELLERLSVLRGDLFYKKFTTDEWEEHIRGARHAIKLRDYMFLSYIKFNNGFLFLFPAKYPTKIAGMNYSTRMQDIIILAHKMGVRYDIIPATKGEDDNT